MKKDFSVLRQIINVARWLPQQFLLLFLPKIMEEKGKQPVVCVPSGNFGNICAGCWQKQPVCL